MEEASSFYSVVVTLLGGIGLFLLGMTLLTDGLKLAAGSALERILSLWTQTKLRGLITGFAMTALVQSSTAMTVAAIGFVNAGLLSFQSALWVVFGSNVGSTVTGWLVAWIGFKIKIDAFALPFIGLGMALKITGEGTRRSGLGAALAGFGLLFLGINLLKDGFSEFGPDALPPLGSDFTAVIIAVGIGILATLVLQASAATLTLALTAVSGGMLSLEAGAGIVIGANIGTTITAIIAALTATPNARRLAAAHVFFNVVTTVVALAILQPLLWFIQFLSAQVAEPGDPVNQLVIFHTVFNIAGVILMWPLSSFLVRFLKSKFRTTEDDLGRPQHLDKSAAAVPNLAQRAIQKELSRLGHLAKTLAKHSLVSNSDQSTEPGEQTKINRQIGRELQACEQLYKAIGLFISELSQRPLHSEISQKLPELLRIATHFDAVAHIMYQIKSEPTDVASRQDTEVLSVLHSALTFFECADPKDNFRANDWIARIEVSQQKFEYDYQVAKTSLLKSGTTGSIPMDSLYETLSKMSDLRRATQQMLKASHRLIALTAGEHIEI